jgi:hypothetical protein
MVNVCVWSVGSDVKKIKGVVDNHVINSTLHRAKEMVV